MKKVLIIEDNPDNQKLIFYAVKKAGYEPLISQTGEEGIAIMEKEIPEFIIMDINLPGMDGIETTKRIKMSETGKKIPVIAITSYALRGDREKILLSGCSGYFEKPIDPLTIVEKIREIIDKINLGEKK